MMMMMNSTSIQPFHMPISMDIDWDDVSTSSSSSCTSFDFSTDAVMAEVVTQTKKRSYQEITWSTRSMSGSSDNRFVSLPVGTPPLKRKCCDSTNSMHIPPVVITPPASPSPSSSPKKRKHHDDRSFVSLQGNTSPTISQKRKFIEDEVIPASNIHLVTTNTKRKRKYSVVEKTKSCLGKRNYIDIEIDNQNRKRMKYTYSKNKKLKR